MAQEIDQSTNQNQEVNKATPKRNRAGRPRLYSQGYQAVRSNLQKSIRLEIGVFNMWNHLKEKSKWTTHSQFASHLLELFKLEQLCLSNPLEDNNSAATGRKRSKRKQR